MSRPGAPTITTPITAGADSLTVAWSAPVDDGGPAITAYDLRYIQTSDDETVDANWTLVEDVWTGSGPLNYIITGLTRGTQYDVQVRAVSAAGDSPWSVTATLPEVPTPAEHSATRSFSATTVAPGAEITVNIALSEYGEGGSVTETLPEGFTLVSGSIEFVGGEGIARPSGNQVRVVLAGAGVTNVAYKVTAPSEAGSPFEFTGKFVNSDGESVDIGGAATVTVSSHSATRSFSATTVAPGAEITVNIALSEYGEGGSVTETLPEGFTLVSGSIEFVGGRGIARPSGNQVRVVLAGAGVTDVAYKVTAPLKPEVHSSLRVIS